jgi:hypothetical protein
MNRDQGRLSTLAWPHARVTHEDIHPHSVDYLSELGGPLRWHLSPPFSLNPQEKKAFYGCERINLFSFLF